MRFSLKFFTFLICCHILSISASCRSLTIEERNELFRANQIVAAPIITALERYHVDKGTYPDDLSVLVPLYLEEIPQPITDLEFGYAIDELRGGYLLAFSVEENSGCGYSPLYGWDCGFGHK
jgi:hypothetical protein